MICYIFRIFRIKMACVASIPIISWINGGEMTVDMNCRSLITIGEKVAQLLGGYDDYLAFGGRLMAIIDNERQFGGDEIQVMLHYATVKDASAPCHAASDRCSDRENDQSGSV
jgi:hypothetical protein